MNLRCGPGILRRIGKQSATSILISLAFLVPMAIGLGETNRPTANTLLLDEVVTQVLSNNPSLKAARAKWEAAQARWLQARAWDDLNAGLDSERRGTTRLHTFNDLEWSLSQNLPLSGVTRFSGQVAAAQADGGLAEVRRRELELAARTRTAYFRYANSQAQLELNRKNRQLLEQFAVASRARYETGTGTIADVLKAETELAKLSEQSFDIELKITEQQSELNVLMNRPAQSDLGPPAKLELKPLVLTFYRPPPSGHERTEDRLSLDWSLFELRLHSLARKHRPEVVAAQKRLDAAQASYAVAKRRWYPDPEIRLELRQFNEPDAGLKEYDTGLFFDLPAMNHSGYRALIQEAEKRVEAAAHELAAVQTETGGLVRTLLKKAATFQFHYLAFRDRIVPLSQQAVQTAYAAYAGGKTSILALLAAQRSAYEAEGVLHEHLAEYLSSVAELEAVVGVNPTLPPEPPRGLNVAD